MHVFGYSLDVPQSLEASSQEVTAPTLRTEGKNMFSGLADCRVLEKCPSSRVQPTKSISLARQENKVREQVSRVSGFVEDAVVWLFGDEGRAMESSPDTFMLSFIRMVVDWPIVKALQSSAF